MKPHQYLKGYMGRYGISYRDMARRLNVSAATVSDWANGMRDIPLFYRMKMLDELIAFSIALEVDRDPPQIEDFLSFEEHSLTVRMYGRMCAAWRKESDRSYREDDETFQAAIDHMNDMGTWLSDRISDRVSTTV